MKKQLKTLLLLVSVLVTLSATAQDFFELSNNRPEIVFSFELDDMNQLQKISQRLSVDKIEGNTITAYANEKEFELFLTYDIPFEVQTPPSMLHEVKMMESFNSDAIMEWDEYPTYDQYVEMMEQFAEDYPDLCEVINFGSSNDGRALLACKISKNVDEDEVEPKVLFTGTMHGDETTGYVLLLRYADYLLSSYENNDERVMNLLDNSEIWINPLANPDGTFHGGNNNIYGATRYNAMNVDLNRNYPDIEEGEHPDGNPWQTENIHFMQLGEEQQFNLSVNFHGGAEVFNYPWDTWSIYPADKEWWNFVGREWADTAHLYSSSSYMTMMENGVCNGYEWYTASGTRQDYFNYWQQCREVTLEISDIKLLPAAQLPAHWEWTYRSFLNYHEQALYGVHGIITNCIDEQPVSGAMVFIEGHDIDSSMVFSAFDGGYCRFLKAGTYEITYSAQGYEDEVRTITIEDKETIIQDVELCCGDLEADFSAESTVINVNNAVNFYDQSSGCPETWYWEFEGGDPATSSDQFPIITYDETGLFDVSLTVTLSGDESLAIKPDFISVSESYNMGDETEVTTCNAIFYDSGAEAGNYDNNEDDEITFYPGTEETHIIASFTMFNVEEQSLCNYDYLQIYDGNSTSASLIGKYCGTESPGVIESTHSSGALTFVFHSDNSEVRPGWKAIMSCSTPPVPPVADFMANETVVGPNDEVQFTDLSENATGWNWTFEGGSPSSSSEQNPAVIYPVLGLYDVSLEVTNDFGDHTLLKEDYIKVTDVSVEDVAALEMAIYPNPVDGEMVSIVVNEKIQKLTLIDFSGKIVSEIEVNASTYELDVMTLQAGLYLVYIETENGSYSQKLIVK